MSRFETFPYCCRKILEVLEREQRRGARNCEKGHLVSLEYAAQLQAAAKASPPKPEGGPSAP